MCVYENMRDDMLKISQKTRLNNSGYVTNLLDSE